PSGQEPMPSCCACARNKAKKAAADTPSLQRRCCARSMVEQDDQTSAKSEAAPPDELPPTAVCVGTGVSLSGDSRPRFFLAHWRGPPPPNLNTVLCRLLI